MKKLIDPVAVAPTLADAVLDPAPVEEGDDSLVQYGFAFAEPPEAVKATKPPKMLVLFVRQLKRGMHGRDVLAIKRALKRAGYKKGIALTPILGLATVRALKRFQKAKGLKVTGVYDRKTHAKLAPFFDAYGAWLLGQQSKLRKPKEQIIREKIVATAIYGYNHRDETDYSQGPHRMDFVRRIIKPPKVPPFMDCSSFATWCYWVAGAKNPNGHVYNNNGYTGEMILDGRVVKFAACQPADLSFYGKPKIGHVVVAIGHGMGVSNGSNAGPLLVPITYRKDLAEIRTYDLV